MKRKRSGKTKSVTSKAAARSMSGGVTKRASIFRNGANQAVRLPQELRFPADVKEVRIRKQGDGLFITPVKPNWSSFFTLQVDVPDDFLDTRNDSPPQSRDPL
jgi:antitoxin VapB